MFHKRLLQVLTGVSVLTRLFVLNSVFVKYLILIDFAKTLFTTRWVSAISFSSTKLFTTRLLAACVLVASIVAPTTVMTATVTTVAACPLSYGAVRSVEAARSKELSVHLDPALTIIPPLAPRSPSSTIAPRAHTISAPSTIPPLAPTRAGPTIPTPFAPAPPRLFRRYDIWRQALTEMYEMQVCSPMPFSTGTFVVDGSTVIDLDKGIVTTATAGATTSGASPVAVSPTGTTSGAIFTSTNTPRTTPTTLTTIIPTSTFFRKAAVYHRQCAFGRPVLVHLDNRRNSRILPDQTLDWKRWTSGEGSFSKSAIPYVFSVSASTTICLVLTVIVLGFQHRPVLYKAALVLSSAYLVTITVLSLQTLNDQHTHGFMDGYLVRRALRTNGLYGLNLAFNTVVYLAQVQTTMLLFSRQKEKRLVFWLGGSLTVVSQTIWGISVFHPDVLQSSLPAFAYLFQIAIAIMYFFCTLYYAMTHVHAIFHLSVVSLTVFAILAPAVTLVLFIVDLANVWVMEWSDSVSWVSTVLAIVIVWEWFERVDQLERNRKKNGILGRQLFDYDDDPFAPFLSVGPGENGSNDSDGLSSLGDSSNAGNSAISTRSANSNSSGTLSKPGTSSVSPNSKRVKKSKQHRFRFSKSRPQRLTGGILLGKGPGYEGLFVRGSNTLHARFDDRHAFLLLRRGESETRGGGTGGEARGESKGKGEGDKSGNGRSGQQVDDQMHDLIHDDPRSAPHHQRQQSLPLPATAATPPISTSTFTATTAATASSSFSRSLSSTPVTAATRIRKYYTRAVVHPIVTVSDFLISLGLAVSRPMSTVSNQSSSGVVTGVTTTAHTPEGAVVVSQRNHNHNHNHNHHHHQTSIDRQQDENGDSSNTNDPQNAVLKQYFYAMHRSKVVLNNNNCTNTNNDNTVITTNTTNPMTTDTINNATIDNTTTTNNNYNANNNIITHTNHFNHANTTHNSTTTNTNNTLS